MYIMAHTNVWFAIFVGTSHWHNAFPTLTLIIKDECLTLTLTLNLTITRMGQTLS